MTLPYWRLSAFYFFYFATLGAFLPFWSLYLKHQAFTANQIGELTACLIVTKIVTPHVFGWLADKSGRRLALIRLSTLLSALLFAGFLTEASYLWFALISLSFSVFWNATLPQFEAATLFHLKNRLSHHYSRIRLWGSIGFILAVLGIGQLLDYCSIDYLPHIITTLLGLNALVAMITPDVKEHPLIESPQGLRHILYRRETIAFFTVYLLLQLSHGPYYVFYSVYLQHHGYSATHTGLLWAMGVCAEIVIFMLAGHLLRWFSLRSLLLSSLALTTGRWWLIAYQIDNPLTISAAQSLHAASFGITHIVAIQLLYQYFGHQHQGKGQALYSSICFGIGGMLGSLYSGYFWDSLGSSAVLALAAVASGVAALIAYLWIGRNWQH